jgi:PAS domain-containing protein
MPVATRVEDSRFLALSVNTGDNSRLAGSVVAPNHAHQNGAQIMTDATSEGLFAAGVAEILAKHIVDALPIPMFAVDNEHRVILWNVPCERLTGIPARFMIGRTGAWSAFYPSERPALRGQVSSLGVD